MPPAEDPEFETLLRHISASHGFDFTAYKRSTLRRRTELRMQALGINTFSAYVDHLEVDPEEFAHFFDAVLINVTGFFRDPPAWDILASQVVPRIIERKVNGDAIRIWSVGCASGEEPYTIAMLMAEALGKERATQAVKIFATDVDEQALGIARNAVYPPRAVRDVPEQLRGKYFDIEDSDCTVNRDLRSMVVFGRHDVLTDAPISRLDLLVCRNTLMYFHAEAQQRILARFMFALREGGFLFLGKAETLLTKAPEVEAVDQKYRIFRKASNGPPRWRLLNVAESGSAQDNEPDSETAARIRESAFDFDPTAQLVVDSRGLVVLVNGAARRLFGIRDRDVGKLLQDLEVSYRPLECAH